MESKYDGFLAPDADPNEVVSFLDEDQNPMQAEIDVYEREMRREMIMDTLQNDPVHHQARYWSFVSRKAGRHRKRKHPKEIEMIYVGGKTFVPKDGKGPVDSLATEVFGDTVPRDEVLSRFMDRIRQNFYMSQELKVLNRELRYSRG